MKKLAIGVLSAGALAAAGALATSYYIGGKVQQTLEQTAEAWSTEDGFTVRVLEYQRGFATSQAKSLWSFANEEDTYDITVTHDIVHGPWPMGHAAKIVSRFELPEDSEPGLIEALQNRAPLEWTTTAGWTGNTAHTLFSPNFAANFEDGSALTWGGLNAEWTLSAERHAAKGFVRMPVLRVKVEEGNRMDIEDAEITFDARIPEGFNFWEGPSSFKVGLVSALESETETQFKLQQLHVSSTTTLKDNLVQMGLDTRVAKVELPDYSMQNFAFDMRFNNVDARWLDGLMLWMQRSTEAQEAPQNTLLRDLPALWAGKPEIAITRLGIETPDGPAELSARVTYVGHQPEAFDPLSDIEAQLHASLPKSVLIQMLDAKVRSDYLGLLEQLGKELNEEELQAAVEDGVSKRLKGLLSLGALKDAEEKYSTELEFGKGGLKLNGQPAELQNLLQMGGAI